MLATVSVVISTAAPTPAWAARPDEAVPPAPTSPDRSAERGRNITPPSPDDDADGEPAPKTAFVAGGVGLGELIHFEAGYFVSQDLSLEARIGNVIFHWMAGLGATWVMVGRGYGHQVTLAPWLRVNALDPGLRGGGEVIRSMVETYLGYGYTARGGFQFRFEGGAMVYLNGDAVEAGPNFRLSGGYVF